ncbi:MULTISPECIES: class I SAM-dependent DNA methyltransferase [Streptomyces]|uniref:Class I SAM-dependent DNA methyltransferase n=1 Tax=Streptomyces nondiastaticus TaxID=3154512 RepID=A0ABW6U6Q8_9ACTN|nr:class I SAM-dependent methyltransferase [Streptomyces sp. VNUA116]WKU46784.1 class I SAM-dependent methyltransferase [Streptomyces sp. VNUA116]
MRPTVTGRAGAVSGDENRRDYDGYARPGLDRSGQAEAFDAIGHRYDEAFPHKEGQLGAGAWLAAALPPGSRVLDLGCGTGLPTARQLADAGHHVVGVDLSPGMLELARGNVPKAEFHLEDLAELRDGRLGTFDGVAAFFSLLMLPRAEIPHALRMLHALLRPGGLLALSMVEADVDDYAIPFLGNTIRVSGYLRDELRQVVREAGFEVAGENSLAYAPASTDVPPEIQLFLNLRRA